MRRLDEVGLTTREACGNSVRNVTACELAEVCPDAAFDVSPYAEAIVRHFLRHPLSSTLPRKFKIAFSGCGTDCAFGAIHDLGFVAQVRDGQRGFKVYAAGGLSTTPQAAITLHEFVPAAEIGRVGEAIVRLFDALGKRDNKARARLKYVLRRLGEEGFRAKYAEIKAQVDAEALAELRLPEHPRNEPAGPGRGGLRSRSPRGYLQWRSACVVDQRQDGYAAVYVRLFLGDVTSAQLRALAGLLPRFGDGTLRLTIDQNLLVPWVDRRSLPALYVALREIGLARTDVHTASDVTSCPGAESCNLAVTSSRNVARAISERLELPDVSSSAGARRHDDQDQRLPQLVRTAPRRRHRLARRRQDGQRDGVPDVPAAPRRRRRRGRGAVRAPGRQGRRPSRARGGRPAAQAVRGGEDGGRDARPTSTVASTPSASSPSSATSRPAHPSPARRRDIGEETGFHVAIGAGECAA